MKNLVIVESPAKKKPIEKYLGKDYEVKASFGHVRDLPSKPGSVIPDDNFSLKYIDNDKSKKHIQEIIKAAKTADKIYLATDPDREGESIAWHVAEILKEKKLVKDSNFIKRISFNEITKKAVTDAVKHPRDIDINLVNAQQARRALDYLVGFTLSPILWRKLPGARSAGRVQSVALRLICEREEEIEKFKTEEYWNINLNFLNSKNNHFTAILSHINNEKLSKFTINNKEQAEELTKSIKKQTFHVDSIDTKQQKRNPPPPFITSTMQQEAARKLGFSAKKTMQIAQKLYEGIEIEGDTIGLITYMRTDGVTLAQEAIDSIRSIINHKFGNDYLPTKAKIYKSKLKNAQEAHEAIRPTNILITPEDVKNILDKDYLKLYDLIWKRTVACQMENVVMSLVSAKLVTDNNQFAAKATGSTIVFDGFYKVYKEGIDDETDEENKLLPPLKEKEKLTLTKVLPTQHFTEPPPKYSEASLIKKLEELGIGRPSTLVSILSVLQERDYVSLVKKKFIPSEKGRLVTAFLMGFFKKYVEYDFTALLENELDDVSAGNLDWKKLLNNFWQGFNANISEASNLNITEVITYLEQDLDHHLFSGKETNKVCPNCSDGKLGLRLGKFGAFLGCSNYPSCNFNKSIMTVAESETDSEEQNIQKQDNNKILGTNKDGIEIFLKKGPYGWYIQEGEEIAKDKQASKEKKDSKTNKTTKDKKATKSNKPKRVSIPKTLTIEDINLDIANALLSLPTVIGTLDNEDIVVGIGRYGPYIKYQDKFISIPKAISIFNITEAEAIGIIKKPKKSKKH